MSKTNMRKRERHGMQHTKVYDAWCHLRYRCNNVNGFNYNLYGGRGITVCERWDKSFLAFYQDMGDPPSADVSIDRIDNDKGYYKENCRWATRHEQSLNRRTNIIYNYNGNTLPLKELCALNNVDYRMVWLRIKRGWGINRAIERPAKILTVNKKRWSKKAA